MTTILQPWGPALVALLLVSACGSGSKGPSDSDPDGGDVDAGSDSGGERPLRGNGEGADFNSIAGCQADYECASGRYCFAGQCSFDCTSDDDCADGLSCSPRGRCAESGADAPLPADDEGNPADWTEPSSTPEVFESVSIVSDATPLSIPVAEGQTEVAIPVVFDGVPGPEGVPYRVELTAPDGTQTIWPEDEPGRLFRLFDQSNEVVLPTGGVGSTVTGEVSEVRIVSGAGEIQTLITPAVDATGLYIGEAEVASFGGADIPLTFKLVVEPVGATLGEATAAAVLLPTADGEVFRPRPSSGEGDDWILRVLERDRFVVDGVERDAWVATFASAYPLEDARQLTTHDGTALDGVLTSPAGTTLQRSIRLEIWQVVPGALEGRISDRVAHYLQVRDDRGDFELQPFGVAAGFRVQRSELLEPEERESLVETPLETIDEPTPFEAPPLDTCEALFTADVCSEFGGIADADSFELASEADRVACAFALFDSASAGTSARDRFVDAWDASLDGDVDTASEFDALREECTSDDGCAAAAELDCARDALLSAYLTSSEPETDRAVLLETVSEVLLDMTFGAQFRAYEADSRLRRQWLSTSAGEVPSVLATSLRNYAAGRLIEWETEVLLPQLEALRILLNPYVVSALSSPVPDTASTEEGARIELLMQITESWRAATENVEISANRWTTILDGSAERDAKAAQLRSYLEELYLASSLISSMNTRAEQQYLNARLNLLQSAFSATNTLSLSWEEIVFSRDAEVVVNTSLDPTIDSATVLQQRSAAANEAVSTVRASVTSVLEALDSNDLRNAQLEADLDDRFDGLVRQISQLCGDAFQTCVQTSGSVQDCAHLVEDYVCGFNGTGGDVDSFLPEDVNTSSAGAALLAVRDAALGTAIASQDIRAWEERASRSEELLIDLEQRVLWWGRLSFMGVQAYDDLITEMVALEESAIQAQAAAFDEEYGTRRAFNEERNAIRDAQLALAVERGELQQAEADQLLDARQDYRSTLEGNIAEWNRMRRDNVNESFHIAAQAYNARARAREITRSATGRAVAEDLAANTFRTSAALAPEGANFGLPDWQTATALAFEAASASLRARASNAASRREDQAAQLDFQRAETDAYNNAALANATELAQLDAVDLALESEEIRAAFLADYNAIGLDLQSLTQDEARTREAEALEILRIQGENQITQQMIRNQLGAIQRDAQLEERERQAALAYDRDLRRLDESRAQHLNLLGEGAGLELRLERAQFAIFQAAQGYLRTTNEAQSLFDQLVTVESRRQNILAMVYSPQAFFRDAARLAEAERSLRDAQEALMDWLVAMEYEAVRPFVNERIGILLAGSPSEIVRMRDRLADLTSTCGGPYSTGTASVSLRRVALGVEDTVYDDVLNISLTPAQQFVESLAEAALSIQRLERYDSIDQLDSTLSGGEVYALTFPISVESFGSLDTACNAKVVGIDLELVGDIGTGLPSVVVVYDGNARVRTCQPNIEDVVNQVGADSTAFGQITYFDTDIYLAALTPGVNQAPAGRPTNQSFNSLPLAADYTVLINTDSPANSDFDWHALEDIVLHVEWRSQAPRTVSACGE